MDELAPYVDSKRLNFDQSIQHPIPPRSTREAAPAVKTLLAWAGGDPARDTPARTVRVHAELFRGYSQNPVEILDRVSGEARGCEEVVLVRDIDFASYREHYMAPFFGRAHIAHYADGGVVVTAPCFSGRFRDNAVERTRFMSSARVK